MQAEDQSVTAQGTETFDERKNRNKELLILAHGGDEAAMETLIIENVALVKSIALKFRDRGCEFEDLMQIGTIGMIKAIKSFQVESRYNKKQSFVTLCFQRNVLVCAYYLVTNVKQ